MSQVNAIEALKSKTMSSIEIAQLTEKNHADVLRDIRAQLFTGLYGHEFDKANLLYPLIQGLTVVVDNYTKRTKEILLDHEHTLTLMTGYDVKARHKINKRWVELESSQSSLSVKEKVNLSVIAREFKGALLLAKSFGLIGNQALLTANKVVEQETGFNCQKALGLDLISPKKEHAITPSDIGVRLGGLSGMKVNQLLKQNGLQIDNRTARNAIYWTPTEKGVPYAQLTDTNKKHSDGTPIKQVKWFESVIELIAV